MAILKYKSLAELEVKAEGDEGIVSGYGSAYGNIDSDGDVIVEGAFADTIARKHPSKIKMLWQHDHRTPIGVYEKLEENSRGLKIRGRIAVGKDVPYADGAFAAIKEGLVESFSVGFITMKQSFGKHQGKNVRFIEKADLMEISPVTFPANQRAVIQSVKGLFESAETIRDYEEALREAGLSRSEACKCASIIYRNRQSESDAVGKASGQGEPGDSGEGILNVLRKYNPSNK